MNNKQFDEIINTFLDKLSGNTCLFVNEKRPKCDKYLQLPDVRDTRMWDKFGRPKGWCEVCWLKYQLEQEQKKVKELEQELKAREVIYGIDVSSLV
jgi:hypothetical protein